MLVPIQRSLAEHRVLGLNYHVVQRREMTRRQVEPLGLVFYADHWHLIAYCRLRRDVRDFRTDRIAELEVLNEQFDDHVDFSLRRYLEAAAQEGRFESARVRFRPEAMERVRREWSCRLVDEKPEPEGTVVTLLAYTLEWLAEWLFSFGSQAEALAPPRLRQILADEAFRLAAQYAAVAHPRPHPVASLLT